MKKKKLVILIWNMNIGGIQKQIKDITTHIHSKHKNWHVFLLIQYKSQSPYLKDIVSLPNTSIYYFSEKKNKSPFFIFWLYSTIKNIQPEVCLTFLDYLSISLIFNRLVPFTPKYKVVLSEEVITETYLKLNRYNFRFWKFLIKFFYPLADLIITPTLTCQKHLINKFHIPKKKIVIIHNWTLLHLSKRKFSNTKNWDLLYIGRFVKEKNILELIPLVRKLLPHFPQIKLAIVGEGNLKIKLEQLISTNHLEKNINVFPATKNIEFYYKNSKLLVLPTLNEGLPNVVLEASMFALPTVSFRFEGSQEVILHRKTGYIASSTSDMVQSTILFLKNPKLREKTGLKAQKFTSRNFSYHQQLEFVKTVLNQSRNPSSY